MYQKWSQRMGRGGLLGSPSLEAWLRPRVFIPQANFNRLRNALVLLTPFFLSFSIYFFAFKFIDLQFFPLL